MTNVEKLVERLRARPTEMRADEIAIILRHEGWTRRSDEGASHQVWMRSGAIRLDYAVAHRKVKRTYLAKIAEALD
jgi:hypothetical protein